MVAAASTVEAQPESTPATLAKVLPFHVGHGFDLHRPEPWYPLIIGGINIPHDRGCEAHSDGDVLLHCVVDAILGALGLPDIGLIFPDADPKWEEGSASSLFMKEAASLPQIFCIIRNNYNVLGFDYLHYVWFWDFRMENKMLRK